jgi:hypothetical protein
MKNLTFSVSKIADIPHEMSHGGELHALSDGSLLVLGKDSWRSFSGAYSIDPSDGMLTERELPFNGRFQALYCDGDDFLLLDIETGEIFLWSPVASSFVLLDTKPCPGRWVAHDTLDGMVYILANLDLSGSDAGFDYEHHVSSMGMFDLKSRSFVDEFKPVRGRDIRGMVMQSCERLVAFGFGRYDAFVAHFAVDFEVTGHSASSYYMNIPIQYPDWMTFIGRGVNNGLLVLGRDNKKHHALTYINGDSSEGEVLWSQTRPTSRDMRYLYFSAAIRISPEQQLLLFKNGADLHQVLLYTNGNEVEELGTLTTIPVSCGVHTGTGVLYVAGRGELHRVEFPETVLMDHDVEDT